MSVDYSEKQRREMARTHLEVGHTGAGSLYFPYHGRRPRRHPLNLAHVSMVHAGHLSIVPSDCDRIPACFGDNHYQRHRLANKRGCPSRVSSFVDCHCCFSGASVSLSEAVKRQLRPPQNADRQVRVFPTLQTPACPCQSRER